MSDQNASNSELLELLLLIADKDKAAFARFYRAMERPLGNFINSKLNDSFQSADILHDVFIEIWKGAGRFEGRSSVKTWVFGIAYRKVMDVFRKAGKMKFVAEIPDIQDESPSAVQSLYATQQAGLVRGCLDKLKPEHRSVVELAFFEDMGYREISEIVGSPEGTVKTRIFHAKKLLMRCLEKHVEPGEV